MEPIKIYIYNPKNTACTFFRELLPYCGLRLLGKVEIRSSFPTFGKKMNKDGKKVFVPIGPDQNMLDNVRWCDLILFGRECYSQGWDLLCEAKKQKKKVVYESDDNLFNVPVTNPAYRVYGQRDVQESIAQFLREADVLSVSIPTLKEYYSKFNKNIVVLPNCIFPPFYESEEKMTRDKFTIGWAGSATHAEDLRDLPFIIEQFQNDSIEFVFMGWTPEDCKNFQNVKGVAGTSDVFEYFENYGKQNFDIVLAPLANMNFNGYKSNIRILEAWVSGYPVIASRSFEYERSVTSKVNGLLAKRFIDWVNCIRMLKNDKKLRESLRENGFQEGLKYDIRRNFQLWMDFLTDLLSRPREIIEGIPLLVKSSYKIEILETWTEDQRRKDEKEMAIEKVVQNFQFPKNVVIEPEKPIDVRMYDQRGIF